MDINPRQPMLYWALTFMMIGSAAAILGSSEVALIPARAARVLYMVFTLLFVAAFILHVFRDGTPTS